MSELLQEDKELLLKERDRSEREAGPVYKELIRLRSDRDKLRKFQKEEKEKPNYEERVAKYEKKANKGALDDSDKAETVQTIAFWVLKSPAILFTIATAIVFIVVIISQFIAWRNMEDAVKPLIIIAAIIIIPIIISIVALINGVVNLIAIIAQGLIWEVYVFFARLFSKNNKKTYFRLHPSGIVYARWHYQAKLYEHNKSFAENEVFRFPVTNDFYKNHQSMYESFAGDMIFND